MPNKHTEDRSNHARFGYFSGYQGALPVNDQFDTLRGIWPDLGPPDAALSFFHEQVQPLELPKSAEGYFVIIRPGFFDEDHHQDCEPVLAALAAARGDGFKNWIADRIIGKPVCSATCEYIHKRKMYHCPVESNLWILPGQFGQRHHRLSACQACHRFGSQNARKDPWCEAALGVRETGLMLLTHPARMQTEQDLGLICAGDRLKPVQSTSGCTSNYEDAPVANAVLDEVPDFCYFGNQLILHHVYTRDAGLSRFGTPTVFIPRRLIVS